jgi:SAM-dependent methyltransferase
MKKNTRTAASSAARRISPKRSRPCPAKNGGIYRGTANDRMSDVQRAKEQLTLYLPGPSPRHRRSPSPAIDRKPFAPPAKSGYRPLASVWYGEDAELLDKMLNFYPRKRPRRILDATVNGGRFWRGKTHPVVGMDIEAKHHPHLVGNNTWMPWRDRAFDVVVYDPPHIPNQGKDKSKDFNIRFGLVLRSSKENGYSFSHTYPPFLKEAYRVLKPEGILLCKISDYIHDHRYQWAHVDLIHAASRIGFCACDCIIKVRKGPIIDPKWKTAHHTRRQHSYWLVFRKSERCE